MKSVYFVTIVTTNFFPQVIWDLILLIYSMINELMLWFYVNSFVTGTHEIH